MDCDKPETNVLHTYIMGTELLQIVVRLLLLLLLQQLQLQSFINLMNVQLYTVGSCNRNVVSIWVLWVFVVEYFMACTAVIVVEIVVDTPQSKPLEDHFNMKVPHPEGVS